MQISGCFIGVDVGKFELQVAGHEGAIVSGIVPNSRSGIVGWLKRLPAGSVIAMEATGGYQELLARLAHERGFVVYVLNPTHVHHYAISLQPRQDRPAGCPSHCPVHRAAPHQVAPLRADLARAATGSGASGTEVNGRAGRHVLETVGAAPWLRQQASEAGPGQLERLGRAARTRVDRQDQGPERVGQDLRSVDRHLRHRADQWGRPDGVVQPYPLRQQRCGGGVLRAGSAAQRIWPQSWPATLEQTGRQGRQDVAVQRGQKTA